MQEINNGWWVVTTSQMTFRKLLRKIHGILYSLDDLTIANMDPCLQCH